MGIFKPDMYQKTIHKINYKELKNRGIKCLIFDLDNTLGLIDNKRCPDETRELLRKLQKDFLVLICSNNTKRRLKPYLEDLGVAGVAWAMKPSIKGLIRVKRLYKLKRKKCVYFQFTNSFVFREDIALYSTCKNAILFPLLYFFFVLY